MANYQTAAPLTSEQILKKKKPVVAAPSVFAPLTTTPVGGTTPAVAPVNYQTQAAQTATAPQVFQSVAAPAVTAQPQAATPAIPQPPAQSTADQLRQQAEHDYNEFIIKNKGTLATGDQSAIANLLKGLDYNTANYALSQLIPNTPGTAGYETNAGQIGYSPQYIEALNSILGPGAAPGTQAYNYGGNLADLPGFKAFSETQKQWAGNPGVVSPGSHYYDAYYQPYFESVIGSLPAETAKSLLDNPQAVASQTNLPLARVIELLQNQSKKVAPKSDLGDPYISPILNDANGQTPTGQTPVFSPNIVGTTPPADPNKTELEQLFSPEQLKLLQAQSSPQGEDALLKQQQDLIRQEIADQTAKNVASARGEASIRGLSGGSFEGRRVGAAQAAGTRATAQELTNLAVESAKAQRAERQQKEQALSSQLFSQLQTQREQEFQIQKQQIDQQFQTFSNEMQREYESLESYKQRAFAAGENDKARYYQDQQNQMQREFDKKMAEYNVAIAKAQADAQRKADRQNAIISSIGSGAGSIASILTANPTQLAAQRTPYETYDNYAG